MLQRKYDGRVQVGQGALRYGRIPPGRAYGLGQLPHGLVEFRDFLGVGERGVELLAGAPGCAQQPGGAFIRFCGDGQISETLQLVGHGGEVALLLPGEDGLAVMGLGSGEIPPGCASGCG